MAVYFWNYDFDPAFPLAVFEYQTRAAEDRLHWHDYLEIAECLDGQGQFVFGRRSHRVEPGDVFLVDNAEPHLALADGQGSLRLLLTLFRPELIAASGCRRFDSDYLRPFWWEGRPFANRLPAASDAASEVRPLLEELHAIARQEGPADRYLLDANLRRVLAVLVRHAVDAASSGNDEAAGEAARGSQLEQVRPVLLYLEDHFRESLTLEQVSEHVHISASRVRHLFKDVTQVGFKEYVTSLRLSEAKRLLLTSDHTVTDVAWMVGYTNLHQFYKVFQRYTSMSPADYRRYYMPASDPHAMVHRPGAPKAEPARVA